MNIEEKKKKCLEIVSYFKAGDLYLSEEEESNLHGQMTILSPDPEISGYIFWPNHYGLKDDMTPEEIVEKAFSYKPIQL